MIYNFNNKDEKEFFFKEHINTIFDYILIGSGPASHVFHEYLKKKNKKILVIEKGNLSVEKNLPQSNKESIISNNNLKIKKNSKISAIGGTANIWAGVSSYIEKIEMISRWGKCKNLWPINHSEITNYYKKFKSKYGFMATEQIKDLNKKNRDNGIYRKRNFHFLINPFKFNILSNHIGTKFLINAKVNYLDQINNRNYIELIDKTKIFSKKIIICCGGLETNFLILRSLKNGKLKNIENKSIAGKFFMDHPKFFVGTTFATKKNFKLLKDISLKRKGNSYFYKGISLSEEIQIKKKMLNSYVRFEKYSYLYLKKKIKEKKLNFKNYLNLILLLIYKLFNKDHLLEMYKITLYNEMVPDKKNKITYLKKNNKEIFDISYKLTKREFKTINFLIKTLTDKMGLVINNKNFKKKEFKNIFKDSSHHMGGTIMGINKKNSFVNKNLEIHGAKNIFICSTSVFPTSGSFNPTMTLCSLAIRLAYFLNEKSLHKS